MTNWPDHSRPGVPQNPNPHADDPGGPHSTNTLAAAVERAAREGAP